jgi:hypothetical protein
MWSLCNVAPCDVSHSEVMAMSDLEENKVIALRLLEATPEPSNPDRPPSSTHQRRKAVARSHDSQFDEYDDEGGTPA